MYINYMPISVKFNAFKQNKLYGQPLCLFMYVTICVSFLI